MSMSPTNRDSYTSGRRRRPISKTHKRTSSSISKKKRNSRTNSLKRDNIVRQYIGHKAKHNNFFSNFKSKPATSHKLNRSFNMSKSPHSGTPQIKEPSL